MIAVKTFAATAVFGVLFGIFSGASIALTPALIGMSAYSNETRRLIPRPIQLRWLTILMKLERESGYVSVLEVKSSAFFRDPLLYLRCGEGFMGLFGTFMFKQSILLVSTSVKATPILGALLTSEYHWIKPILFSGVCLLLKSYVTVLLKDLCARLH